LLNEGSGQKQDLVQELQDFTTVMEEIENIWKNSGMYGSICFF
jgi:chaperonin cofactor prefoldin